MSAFSRDLNVSRILDHVRTRPDGAVAFLLANWVVPGAQRNEGKPNLRLAIRNGYANFYINGQSVAKLTSSTSKLEIETHWKYRQGVRKAVRETRIGQEYPRFSATELDVLTPDEVAGWIQTAATYADAEKSFVEQLVASNPNVIDLETALPGKTAPRMDLAVVFERRGKPTIGFWEAKCIDNGELRASTLHDPQTPASGPKVIRQAGKYVSWLSDCGQREHLQAAYQRTGQIYLDLADGLLGVDPKRFGHLERLDGQIRRLGDELPEVILTPGLVVGAYCPSAWLKGRQNSAAEVAKFANKLRSYRLSDDSHETRVKAHFANYACFEIAGTHELPELTA